MAPPVPAAWLARYRDPTDRDLRVMLEHALGAADLARATLLANPSPVDLAARSAELRARRAVLEAERATIAAHAPRRWRSRARASNQ
ncbi:MAG: hypothetical protein ACKVX7_20575 [Planctomycetota bacterium]